MILNNVTSLDEFFNSTEVSNCNNNSELCANHFKPEFRPTTVTPTSLPGSRSNEEVVLLSVLLGISFFCFFVAIYWLVDQCRKAKKANADVGRLRRENSGLIEENSGLIEENSGLQRQNSGLKEENSKLQRRNSELKEENCRLSLENRRLQMKENAKNRTGVPVHESLCLDDSQSTSQPTTGLLEGDKLPKPQEVTAEVHRNKKMETSSKSSDDKEEPKDDSVISPSSSIGKVLSEFDDGVKSSSISDATNAPSIEDDQEEVPNAGIGQVNLKETEKDITGTSGTNDEIQTTSV